MLLACSIAFAGARVSRAEPAEDELAQLAQDEPLPESTLDPAAAPLFSLESPLGPIEYGLGRGLELGRTGFHIGGFTTVEFDLSLIHI